MALFGRSWKDNEEEEFSMFSHLKDDTNYYSKSTSDTNKEIFIVTKQNGLYVDSFTDYTLALKCKKDTINNLKLGGSLDCRVEIITKKIN